MLIYYLKIIWCKNIRWKLFNFSKIFRVEVLAYQAEILAYQQFNFWQMFTNSYDILSKAWWKW